MPASPILQARTVAVAHHRGEIWTSAELEFLKGTFDMPAVEVAEALGRTLQSVYTYRSLDLAADRPSNATRTVSKVVQPSPTACGACFTFHPAGVDCY